MTDQNQVPQKPESPMLEPQQDLDKQNARDFKVAQNLVLAASLAGPVSLFFGGVLLSGAGLACAIIALRKTIKLSAANTDMQTGLKMVKRTCIVALVICSITFALNAVAFFILYPMVVEALETGDYSNLTLGIEAPSNTPGPNSTWG